MNFNLQMLNLWIGLCKGVRGLPPDLRVLGYEAYAIEKRFKNSDLKDCHPELIACSKKQQHTLLLEWKSGNNVEAEQLVRYSRVSGEDLAQRALLPVEACRSHDVTVIGQNERIGRLRIGLESSGVGFPLVAASEKGLALVHNEFHLERLNSVFRPLLQIDMARAPTVFVPIDPESTLIEVAEVVIPKVLEHMAKRDVRVKVSDIAASLTPVWSVIQRDAQNLIRDKVAELLDTAAEDEFAPFFEYTGGSQHEGTLDITNNPMNYGSDRRSTEYKRLQKCHRELCERLASGKRRVKQFDLFVPPPPPAPPKEPPAKRGTPPESP